MKIYFPLAKIDAEKHEVWGYASTEARDEQGEVVKRGALISALGDYMQFANIREMHQLSAVGVAKEAAVDDKGLYVGAKIVDPVAWQKVVEGVYKGYSIGGRVTNRDPADYKTITGLVLNEISLVDRPANPEAVFDYWKSAGGPEMPEVPLESAPDKSNTGLADGSAYDDDDYADPGYQPDGQKRYPISTEPHIRAAWNFINRSNNVQRYTRAQLDKIKARIVAAWKQKIDKDGPPSLKQEKRAMLLFRAQLPLTKALGDVGNVARILRDLTWLQESLTAGAQIAEDNFTEPSRVQAIISELCGFLSTLVTDETSEILDQADLTGEPPIPKAADTLIVAAGAQGARLIADLCRGRNQRLQQLAATILIKSRQADADQALLDVAHQAISQCLGTHGLLSREKGHLAMAQEALNAAGALAGEAAEVDAEHTSKHRPPMVRAASSVFHSDENGTFDSAVCPSSSSKVIEMIAAALSKGAPGHLALLDLAHGCISKLTNGVCCHFAKAGDRNPKETSGHLLRAHDHLIAAGAECDRVICDGEKVEGTGSDPTKAESGHLAKILAGERAEKAALIATLADVVPRLDQLTKRVEDIARTPLPPVTMAKTIAAIAKRQDTGSSAFSTDELAAAFSQMSKEEQTLTLIKASYTRPIHPPGLNRTQETVGE